MPSFWVISFAILTILVFRALLKVLRAFQSCPSPASFTLLEHTLSVIPRTPGISLGLNHIFVDKHTPFKQSGWDVASIVSVVPKISATIYVAEANVVKEITAPHAPFEKAVHRYKILKLFGPNIVASEGEEWKRYKRMSDPAFSEGNNRLVWDESVKIMEDLFTTTWESRDINLVNHCDDLTLPIALSVISVAGFGQSSYWKDNALKPILDGHKMKFKDALHIVATNTVPLLLLPRWALSVTRGLRKADLAVQELTLYMSEMIKERRCYEGEKSQDLFSSLMAANDEDTDLWLSDREVMGNIYVFLLAGHETTAHTLTFCFALLALYQEEQETLYNHIRSVVPAGRNPMYTDIPQLTHAMAVFYETLRMFSPTPSIPKISTEDTTLVIENANGQKRTIPIQKNTDFLISVPGLHYNPRYWKDPHSFRPSRFLDDWPRDAFIPFSLGNRACIGQKFFETEGLAILTMMLSEFKIEVQDEPQFRGESFEEKKDRILKTKVGLTLTPVRVPLVFTRRTSLVN